MRVIGVTGPSGSGKGKVSKRLAEYGFAHIDADVVYHDLLVPPSPCLDEIVKCFGKEILNNDGTLNRSALGKIVFAPENKEKLLLLNSITHKFVCGEICKMICENFADNTSCVIDAPLLIESGLCRDCDTVIAVLADASVRAQRIAARDGISLEDANKRISAQNPDAFYIESAKYVVYNNSDVEDLYMQIENILSSERLGGEA